MVPTIVQRSQVTRIMDSDSYRGYEVANAWCPSSTLEQGLGVVKAAVLGKAHPLDVGVRREQGRRRHHDNT